MPTSPRNQAQFLPRCAGAAFALTALLPVIGGPAVTHAAPPMYVREFLSAANVLFASSIPPVSSDATRFDLNGDGIPEIATRAVSGGVVTFSFYDSRDGHLVQSTALGAAPGGQNLIGVYDINRDSLRELIVQFDFNPGLTVAAIDPYGDVTFFSRNGTVVGVFDIDLDGKPELILNSPQEPPGQQRVEVWGDGLTIPTAVGDTPGIERALGSLAQNAPNPFNPATRIEYQVQIAGPVLLRVYNVAGQLVRTLVDERRGSGNYIADWNGDDDRGTAVASGAYVYQLQVGEFVASKKMVMVR